jgi:hypothetical protein
MKHWTLRFVGPVLVAVMLGGPAAAAAGLPTQARPVPAATASAPITATTVTTTPAADTKSYAEREKQAAGLEQWQGGASGGIYIGGSALALVLLLVILVLLL